MTQEKDALILSRLTNDDCERWDSYVRESPYGLPLHLSGWRHVLHKTYGYETPYLMARVQEHIVGVMPLFLVPSFLTGKRAMTMPGGICTDDEAIAARLIEQAVKMGTEGGIERTLIQDSRQEPPDQFDSFDKLNGSKPKTYNWNTESSHVYWIVDLDQSEEALWKRLDGNIRRQVRKARKNGLRAEIDRTGELLDPFYDIFSRFTHQAGTPVFSRAFLKNTINTFPNGFNIAVVWHGDQPIAGYFQLEMNKTVYGMWGAALPETQNLRPAYLALWEIMREANNSGFSYLDMGRSPAGSNASKFKGQWGGISHPVYQTIINANQQKPAQSVTNQVQSNDQFQLFMRIWPKLPLSFTRRLGPKLRWHIPFA